MNILVIEDNQKLNKNICTILASAEYTATGVLKGSTGVELTLKQQFDLIIIDLNLPDIDGIEVCKILRQYNTQVPLLMLTARVDTESKVTGLDTGADDYMTKPFVAEELLARLRALLRRWGDSAGNTVQIGDVVVDLKSRTVTNQGEEIPLSSTEIRIIEYLLAHKGHVCSDTQIYDSVWGTEDMAFSTTLKVHISRIRKKVNAEFITTVPGFGYTIK